MQRTVTLAVAGAGLRSLGYARRAVADGQARIVAVAEPRADARNRFAAEFAVPAEMTFVGWEELLAGPRVAEAIVIGTQDAMHAEPAIAAAALGYHILLEKPMATSENDCVRIADAVQRAGVLLAVCHVLRYTPYTQALMQVVDAGGVGDIVSVQHLEPVGWWHQAHSFVRGNWRREDESSPMLMAKACHDVDWLIYVMGQNPSRVSSFGGLHHFRPERRPVGAADNCLDCAVESTCPYSARRLYLSCLNDPQKQHWLLSAITEDHTEAGVLDALRGSPYGRCVYDCDNDVVDHQVVNFEFPGGSTASFTMTAFTPLEHRKTRIFGSAGCIEGDGEQFTIHDFVTDRINTVATSADLGVSAADGHGGGDDALVDAFVSAVATGNAALILSDARTSLASHQVVWAAERSRHDGTVVSLPADTAAAGYLTEALTAPAPPTPARPVNRAADRSDERESR